MKDELHTISDNDLVQTLKSFVQSEREATADVIRYLHEVDCRRLYLPLGYSSLFAFVTEGLGYSEGSAYRRIQAARSIEATPQILERLEAGKVSLCTIAELSKVTPLVREGLLPLVEGKTKEEVKKAVAPYLPLRAIPKERGTVSPVLTPAVVATPLFSVPPEAPRKELVYSVTLELNESEMALLTEVVGLSGCQKKSQAIVKALKLYRKVRSPEERQKRRDARRQKRAVTATVKVETPKPTITRYVSPEVRDLVVLRDGPRCTFHGIEGHRCSETKELQIDHEKPFAIGGENTLENLRVLCAAHNRGRVASE